MSRVLAGIVYFFTAAFFGCFLFWPIAQALRGAFVDANGALTAAYLVEVFRNRLYVEGLENALFIGIAG